MKKSIILIPIMLVLSHFGFGQKEDSEKSISKIPFVSNQAYIELGANYLLDDFQGNNNNLYFHMVMPNRINDFEIAMNVGYDYWSGKHGLMLGYSAASFFNNFYIRSELYLIHTFSGEEDKREYAVLSGNLGYTFDLFDQENKLRLELKINTELIQKNAGFGLALLYSPWKKPIP